MFADLSSPRVFCLPPGVDFVTGLLAGLENRLASAPPEAWARTTLYVPNARMRRRLIDLFDLGPARILPQIRLVTDLGQGPEGTDLPPAMSATGLRLDLADLLHRLADHDADVAPRHSLFDLADSLATLIEEMESEGVSIDALEALDMSGHAAHWQRNLAIIQAAARYLASDTGDMLPTAETRRRLALDALLAHWEIAPPDDPVIVAGSTGSRGTTHRLMEAVARLPQGAVVLPGVDPEMEGHHWAQIRNAITGEDHPQYRFGALFRTLGQLPEACPLWHAMPPAAPERNRLISLSLCPAPVTDRWRRDGQALVPELPIATVGIDLIEATDQRQEARAIALRLRTAVAEGLTVALVTPDRMLTRQVAAALSRWGIEPDDSAGDPLHLSAPGRLMRQVADCLVAHPSLAQLIALLKNPLVSSSEGNRGPHMLRTRALELFLRDRPQMVLGAQAVLTWATDRSEDDQAWAAWLASLFDGFQIAAPRLADDWLTHHLTLCDALAAGVGADGSGALWEERPGEAATAAIAGLREATANARGGMMPAADYARLVVRHLQSNEVQDPVRPHPGVRFWGTLEARVERVDLTILGSLNEGIWPGTPGADPWLNRSLRQAAGLLLPDRRIGLAAHDYQIAMAAPKVVVTRSLRDSETETVPSRWLNRLTGLLGGLGHEGQAALDQMRTRGRHWIALSETLDQPTRADKRAPRPAPAPPLLSRPNSLSVTDITRLIRDPFAIYARHILGLRPLAPLTPMFDARARGIAVHEIMRDFLAHQPGPDADATQIKATLDTLGQQAFAAVLPIAAQRLHWLARFARIIDDLALGEKERAALGRAVVVESSGSLVLPGIGFTLRARPDRIDRLTDGHYAVYDYKTGLPPTEKQVDHYDKQLVLEAAMVERGGFTALAPAPVTRMEYLALGVGGSNRPIREHTETGARRADLAFAELHRLIANYQSGARGYASRRQPWQGFGGDYDHLARYGEWDMTDLPQVVPVGIAQ